MSKIYDCFNFFNELDVLEIRLNTLYDYVDHFVIVESNVTHSGEKKPYYFNDNKDRFSKFLDKIIVFKIEDNPIDFTNLPHTDDIALNQVYNYIKIQTNRFNRQTQPDYGRDFFQKESVRRSIVNCSDDDVILFSDLDEIPNPNILKNIKDLDLNNNIYSLNQYFYCYFLNVLKQKDWYGTKILKYGTLKNLSLNEVRGDLSLSIKLDNGGWHFSFMGGKEMVENKLKSYSARDMANNKVVSSIESNMGNLVDPFFRGNLEVVEIDDTYPDYILNNKEKYKHLIKV
jgi:beta-1,4-mannosyl-glycoprotein beta-1,4-N-acetylglucosaminyltransferase